MKNACLRGIALIALIAVLAMALASCGTSSYSRLGISFEIPSRFEEKAVAGAKMAFGDDESFIVFNKYTETELASIGVENLDVKEYTEYFLEKSQIGVEDVVYDTSGLRAAFTYVVSDPEVKDVYYFYSVVILKGTGCIWAVQMACYADLMYEYMPEFEKWAASLKAD